MVYFRVADLKITMLASKRLGVDRKEFERAINAFSSAHYEEEFEGARVSFPGTGRNLERTKVQSLKLSRRSTR